MVRMTVSSFWRKEKHILEVCVAFQNWNPSSVFFCWKILDFWDLFCLVLVSVSVCVTFWHLHICIFQFAYLNRLRLPTWHHTKWRLDLFSLWPTCTSLHLFTKQPLQVLQYQTFLSKIWTLPWISTEKYPVSMTRTSFFHPWVSPPVSQRSWWPPMVSHMRKS